MIALPTMKTFASSSNYLVRRLRLRHLELLVALDEAGTMRGAATRLNLSQPALSKMLGEVEAGLAVRLFDRSHRGLAINAAGRAAVHRARVMLNELARAADEVQALAAGASAVLRLGTLSVTSAVPLALTRLRRQLPDVAVQITDGRVRDLIDRLLDGELDGVFAAITPELLGSDLLVQLQADVLLPDEICVLAATDHPLAKSRAMRWRDLRDATWIVPPKDTLVRQAFMTAFLDGGLHPPEPAIEVLSSVTIGSLLRLDPTLLAAVRHEHARDELARGGVCRLAVRPTMRLPAIGLYTRRGTPPTLVLQAFARALQRSARPGASRT